MKLTIISSLLAFCFGALITGVNAQENIPKLINYQGRLNDAGGAALPDGTYKLRFGVYSKKDSTQAGDSLIWGMEYNVTLVGGQFNAVLGAGGGTPVAGAAVNDIGFAFTGAERYVQLTVLTDNTGANLPTPQVLLPRQQLMSAPFAIVSQTSDRASVAVLAESLIPELARALNPPGTIIAYAGAVADNNGLVEPIPGYLLCNGAIINGLASNGKYSVLKSAIGRAWGNGGSFENENLFNLPDLRGVFLRGWSGTALGDFVDPDKAARFARLQGGNVGNNVGSFQMDEFKSHNHNLRLYETPDNTGDRDRTYDSNEGDNGDPKDYSTTSKGGSETRGKNANVVYLIKY